jgi:DNA-binding NtrC family response regulator
MQEASKRRVLVVDGNADIRQLIGIAVEKAGGEALLVSTIGEAEQLIDNGQFDILICDVGTSNGNCEKLVSFAHVRKSDMPVIIFTDGYRYSLSSPLRGDHCFTVERFNFRQMAEILKVLLEEPGSSNEP